MRGEFVVNVVLIFWIAVGWLTRPSMMYAINGDSILLTERPQKL